MGKHKIIGPLIVAIIDLIIFKKFAAQIFSHVSTVDANFGVTYSKIFRYKQLVNGRQNIIKQLTRAPYKSSYV